MDSLKESAENWLVRNGYELISTDYYENKGKGYCATLDEHRIVIADYENDLEILNCIYPDTGWKVGKILTLLEV